MDRAVCDDTRTLLSRPLDIWPNEYDDVSTKRFCIARFVIWYAIILSFLHKSTQPLKITVGVLCVLYVVLSSTDNSHNLTVYPNAPQDVPVNHESRHHHDAPLYVLLNQEMRHHHDAPVNHETRHHQDAPMYDETRHQDAPVNHETRHQPDAPVNHKTQAPCRPVTRDNPYGNPPVETLDAVPTCLNQFDVSDQYYLQGLPADETDVFRTQNSMRQFYTMPVTTDINRQTEFAEWCYNPTVDRTHVNQLVSI